MKVKSTPRFGLGWEFDNNECALLMLYIWVQNFKEQDLTFEFMCMPIVALPPWVCTRFVLVTQPLIKMRIIFQHTCLINTKEVQVLIQEDMVSVPRNISE